MPKNNGEHLIKAHIERNRKRLVCRKCGKPATKFFPAMSLPYCDECFNRLGFDKSKNAGQMKFDKDGNILSFKKADSYGETK